MNNTSSLLSCCWFSIPVCFSIWNRVHHGSACTFDQKFWRKEASGKQGLTRSSFVPFLQYLITSGLCNVRFMGTVIAKQSSFWKTAEPSVKVSLLLCFLFRSRPISCMFKPKIMSWRFPRYSELVKTRDDLTWLDLVFTNVPWLFPCSLVSFRLESVQLQMNSEQTRCVFLGILPLLLLFNSCVVAETLSD